MENSSNNNSENADNTPQRLPLTFGPETLDKLKSGPDFIAAYGSIPAFGSSEERDQWIDTLSKIMEEINANFDHEMSRYSYPNGPVTGCGVTIDGVLKVGINKSEKVEKPFMDEIYKIFDSKASQMGLKEVPVVFVYEDNPVPTVATETPNLPISGEKNTGRLNNSNNDSEPNNGNISNINSSSENDSSKENSTPGFSLLGGLICLYGVGKCRKK
ncbi:hypothetical protein [Methanosarcina barkeri]|nr:hypothetical protein [Methanosarcina barkeri]AKB54979.1 hypothetical protein MSBRM_1981 [Methanosarcina barkeri MS]AKB56951.1 hypothetical protein MSBR2_0435 [Methanosarcina barkeri 227]OED08890.1 hypothetical protein A9239_08790 [Methanosarcina sp. A14]